MPIIVPGAGGGTGGQDALTFLELQNEVLAHGFNAGRYRERVKRWLNEGIHRVCRVVKFPDTGSLVTVAGEASVALPGASVRVREIFDPSTNTILDALTEAEFDQEPTTASGRPTGYMVSGAKVYLAPTPNQVYALEIRFNLNSPDFVSDNDTYEGLGLPPLMNDYAMLPVSWALSRAYRSEDDAEMSVFYKREFQDDLVVLRGDVQMPTTQQRKIGGGPVRGPRFRLPGR